VQRNGKRGNEEKGSV
jgi:hypothetical protein